MQHRNRQIVLAQRPRGNPLPQDFRLVESDLPALADGQALIRNEYFSMDAGFRHWMDEGSGDEYLPEMALGAPVMSLILGRVEQSRNPDLPEGERVMGRLAWEEYSVVGGPAGAGQADEFLTRLPAELEFPAGYYLGVLGGTGMTAYFGMMDIGRPQPDETVLVSAAAGAVGSVAGQIAKIHGARVVGMAGNDGKCRRLVDELGFDQAINYRAHESLNDVLADLMPDGVDVYFDNVGGVTLNTVLHHLKVGARVPLCGSVSAYGASEPPPGPDNMFELVTKRALLQGFMYTDQVERYPEAMAALGGWLRDGKLKNTEHVLAGIENAGVAFCEMFAGKNFGKTLVKL